MNQHSRGPTQPPFQAFRDIGDETWRWLHLEGREQCPFLEGYLPSVPNDPAFEELWVGSSGARMLAQGFDIYKLFKDRYEQYAGPLKPESRVLDFGCGFGRVIRFFTREVAPENLIGIDKSKRAIAACDNRWSQFQRCQAFPPADLEAGSFDLIYAFSVFSHLSEQFHKRWLTEFGRLLRPDGVVILTTFPRSYLATDADLAERFSPLQETLAAYDRGEYCYRPHPPAEHFGSTFIPEPYARERWPFAVREYFDVPAWGQSIVVCTNPRQPLTPDASPSEPGSPSRA